MAEIEEKLIKSIIRGFNRIIILWLLSREPMSEYKILKSLRDHRSNPTLRGGILPTLRSRSERVL